MRFSGASRTQRTSGIRSFNATSAALSMRSVAAPDAMRDSAPTARGAMMTAVVGEKPLVTGELKSRSFRTLTFFAFLPAISGIISAGFSTPHSNWSNLCPFGDATTLICSTRSSPESSFSNVRWTIVPPAPVYASVMLCLFDIQFPRFSLQPFIQLLNSFQYSAQLLSPMEHSGFHRPDRDPPSSERFLLWITHRAL